MVVATSVAIVTPLWLLATKTRSLYNVLLLLAFAIGVGWMIVRRISSQAEQTGLLTALGQTCIAAARLVGWVTTLAGAPLFVLALFSTGATLPGILLVVADLGAIGFLLTSGRRNSADGHG